PLYFVLLVFAGAAWQPRGEGLVVVAAAFLVGRLVVKTGSARLAARVAGTLPALGPRWGTGLFGHGGLALAIGLNYRLHEASPLANVVFTATLASVLLTDLLSARLVRRVVGGYAERVRRARRWAWLQEARESRGRSGASESRGSPEGTEPSAPPPRPASGEEDTP
ncbi:MAG TPA: hypothetical protein VMK65_03500, partial [Longimicrobiales bacterium]|nr:hypothetical protein [Longimicrobiales bacterium]